VLYHTLQLSPYVAQAIDAAAPTANATAAVTYAAGGPGLVNRCSGLAWSYSGTPAGGSVSLSDGGTVIFTQDVTAAGVGHVTFNPPKEGTANTAMTATLAAGGAGVSGKLNASHATARVSN
jgi:hypothetical protein